MDYDHLSKLHEKQNLILGELDQSLQVNSNRLNFQEVLDVSLELPEKLLSCPLFE